MSEPEVFPPPKPKVTPQSEPVRSGSVFLETSVYRRRRLIDTAHVLPVLALALFLCPAFLTFGDGSIKARWIFFFAAWVTLIIATAVLSRALRRARRPTGGTELDHLERDA